MEGQIQAVPIVIDEEDPNEPSIIYGTCKFNESSNTLFQNLSVGVLNSETPRGGNAAKTLGKPDISSQSQRSGPKDSTLNGATKFSKIGESPVKKLDRPPMSFMTNQAKGNATGNGAQANGPQEANNWFKNKQTSDRIVKIPQKNSNKDSSREKSNQLIIIDDELDTPDLIDTTENERHGKPRIGILSKEAHLKSQNNKKSVAVQQIKDDAVIELRNDSSESKKSVGKKTGSKKVGYVHKIQSLQNINSAQRVSSGEDVFNANSKSPREMKPGPSFTGNSLLEFMGMAGGAMSRVASMGPFNPMAQALWQTMLSRYPSSVFPVQTQELMYKQYLDNYMQHARSASRTLNPISFPCQSDFEKLMNMDERERTKNNGDPQSEEIIHITDEFPESFEPKVIEIKDGETDKMVYKGGGKKLFKDEKAAISIFEKAFNKKLIAKREKKAKMAKAVEEKEKEEAPRVEEPAQTEKKTPTAKTQSIKPASTRTPSRKNLNRKTARGMAKTKAPQIAEEKAPLEENLEKPKRKTRGTRRASRLQTPAVTSSVVSESPAKREGRRRNKLQIITEEKEKKKDVKGVTEESKAEENEEEEEEWEEEEEEEEFASLCNWPNPLKRIKPMGVGEKYQAVIPGWDIKGNATAPRRFKCVWDPSSVNEEKTQEFFTAVGDILRLNTYHEDFLIRLLGKNQMDFEKTLSLIKTSEEFFVNLFKLKKSWIPLKKLPQQAE